MDWVIKNAEWIFSGIGVAIFTLIVGLFFKNKDNKSNSQSIKSGNNSTNIQGGKNVTVTIGDKKSEKQ